jgi:hypothetical protein
MNVKVGAMLVKCFPGDFAVIRNARSTKLSENGGFIGRDTAAERFLIALGGLFVIFRLATRRRENDHGGPLPVKIPLARRGS